MGQYALCCLWHLRIGMAVKGSGSSSRRLKRSRRGRTKRQRCAKHFRGRGRQRGGQAAGAPTPTVFSVRWPSLGAAKEAAAAASPPPLLERQPCLQAAGPLTPTPSVTIPPGGPYALIVWDPDAPQASWLHWLVVNIPGGRGLQEGSTVVPWAPPTPPPGTGTHTYIFGLFLQGQTIDPKTVAQEAALSRAHFNPARFAEQYGLRQVDDKRIAVSAGPLP